MIITIFGATGRTGKELMSQALERGYDVVVYVRDSSKITIDNPRLTIVQGELDDEKALVTTIGGSDCVLSALGPMGKPGDEELSDGISNILSAMEKCSVTRFVALSTTSAQDPHDIESFRTKLRRDMIKRGRSTSYKQIRNFSQLIRDSNSEWTLVRIASVLTDKPLSKHICAGYLGKNSFSYTLSRADLAWFMLEQITSTEHLRKAPALSS